MKPKKYTIGIYGIQDNSNSAFASISHDHSIACMQDGKIIFSAQIERINRQKYSKQMPEMLLGLLKSKNLLNKTADFVFVDNVLGRSFINKEGNIRFETALNKGLKNNIERGNMWFLDRSANAFALNHELAHLGSCLPFFGSFKNNSLLIHFDGGASKSNFSAWHYINKKIIPVEHHWDLKYLSSLYNANALVFAMVKAKRRDLNSVPGKFMGFAVLGKYDKKIEEWLRKNYFFENCWKSKTEFISSLYNDFGTKLKQINQKNRFIQNIAATIQEIFIRESFEKIKELQKRIKADYLFYSGGSALNILLNTHLINSSMFNDVFIPPCCNDSGLAIGAAAFLEWSKKKKIVTHSPYINNWGIEDYKINYNENTIKEVANCLLKKQVIGICNLYAEIGPRALGNRSILSLASDKKLAQKVSMEHKQREWYRPVAPVMLKKNTEYFTGKKQIHHLSKYMLLDFEILADKQKELSGAVHTNGTARIQTIFNKNDNPFLFDLLSYLDKNHNVKALINTSFNGKGEPMVHTTDDAIKSAYKMKLDAVVLNGELQFI